MEIQVKGHSGCNLEIVDDDGELFVLKTTQDESYFVRLQKQADKQISARQFFLHNYNIRIPKIFKVEKNENFVQIKMEYVFSKSFVEYFECAGFVQVKHFVDAIIAYLNEEIEMSTIQELPCKIVREKFIDVKKRILLNTFVSSDPEIWRILNVSEEKIEQKKRIEIPIGVCHGDLTFSNVLFNGNQYYLIDFLDSFVESPLIDIVKIRQDSAYLWSELMYTKGYDHVRLKIICKKIDLCITKYFERNKWYRDNYNLFQLLNMLRILQYAKDVKVINFLKRNIKELLYEK